MFFPLFQSVFLNGKYSVVNPAQAGQEIPGESVIVNAGQWKISINDPAKSDVVVYLLCNF